uniref:Uncharacterized protein n=1 Tax=Arundo donax TaxID=35708 RepID=A0A0A9G344_ARUDO
MHLSPAATTFGATSSPSQLCTTVLRSSLSTKLLNVSSQLMIS